MDVCVQVRSAFYCSFTLGRLFDRHSCCVGRLPVNRDFDVDYTSPRKLAWQRADIHLIKSQEAAGRTGEQRLQGSSAHLNGHTTFAAPEAEARPEHHQKDLISRRPEIDWDRDEAVCSGVEPRDLLVALLCASHAERKRRRDTLSG